MSSRQLATLFILLAALVMVFVIGGGFFDPVAPEATAVTHHSLPPITLAAGERRLVWLPDVTLPDGDYAIRLTAARQSGELDIAYGLAVGSEGRFLVTAVGPVGYVGVWEEETVNSQQPTINIQQPIVNDQRQETTGNGQWAMVNGQWSTKVADYVPWQTWPHVRTGEGVNEIWLVRQNGRITLRINGELLWQAPLPITGSHIALYAATYGDTAVLQGIEVGE
jgi:hypothetical protein